MTMVDELRSLLARATPGPWVVKPVKGYCIDEIITEHPDYAPDRLKAQHRAHIMEMADKDCASHFIGATSLASGHPKQNFEEDAALIVALRNNAEALLDALTAQDARVKELEGALAPFAGIADLFDEFSDVLDFSEDDRIDVNQTGGCHITQLSAEDFRAARAALDGEPG